MGYVYIIIYTYIYIYIYIDVTNHKLFVVIENGGLNMVLMPCFSRKHDDEPWDIHLEGVFFLSTWDHDFYWDGLKLKHQVSKS